MSRGRLRAPPTNTIEELIDVDPEVADDEVTVASEELIAGNVPLTRVVCDLDALVVDEVPEDGVIGGDGIPDLANTLVDEKGIHEDDGLVATLSASRDLAMAFAPHCKAATFAPRKESVSKPVYEDVSVA